MKGSLGSAVGGALCLVWVTSAAAQVPDHLRCYRVRDPQAKTSYTADLDGVGCIIKLPAKIACVPTTKTNVSPTPPGGGGSTTAGSFLCYNAKCPRPVVALTLPGADQFGSRTLAAHTTKFLCAPVTPTTMTSSTMTITTTTTTTVPDLLGRWYFEGVVTATTCPDPPIGYPACAGVVSQCYFDVLSQEGTAITVRLVSTVPDFSGTIDLATGTWTWGPCDYGQMTIDSFTSPAPASWEWYSCGGASCSYTFTGTVTRP
jgi:hypothetical protein